MDWVDKPQNYKDLYGILQLLRLSHLNNFPLKTLKLGWVAFHSVTFPGPYLGFFIWGGKLHTIIFSGVSRIQTGSKVGVFAPPPPPTNTQRVASETFKEKTHTDAFCFKL